MSDEALAIASVPKMGMIGLSLAHIQMSLLRVKIDRYMQQEFKAWCVRNDCQTSTTIESIISELLKLEALPVLNRGRRDDLHLLQLECDRDLHQKLKIWCVSHGLNMGEAVQGAIEQFLNKEPQGEIFDPTQELRRILKSMDLSQIAPGKYYRVCQRGECEIDDCGLGYYWLELDTDSGILKIGAIDRVKATYKVNVEIALTWLKNASTVPTVEKLGFLGTLIRDDCIEI